MKKLGILLIICFSVIYFNCKDNKKDEYNLKNKKNNLTTQNFKGKIFIKLAKDTLHCGDTLHVKYKIQASVPIDSVFFYVGTKTNVLYDTIGDYILSTKDLPVGVISIKVYAYSKDKYISATKKFLLLSDIIPTKYKYKVIKTYPHDPEAYTQGLIYENGIFYESTGLETKSSIRKVKVETGEVIYSHEMPENIFGEGIAIIGDRLYQITWRNHIAFVYNKNSFEELDKFTYSTEGWGLTTDGNVLYMSDGTNKIYVRDPHTFGIIRTIEVYDNQKAIPLLNELEYINGKIWANVYTKDYIVIINPQNGKVEGVLDCKGILKKKYRTPKTDVLNGIAYDIKNKRIFITGKNWSKLFQIAIERK